MPSWGTIKIDDFIVAVSKYKSNSVYHVAEVTKVVGRGMPRAKRIFRYKIKVYKSDLITMLKRDPDQELIIMSWYRRNKKKL